MSNVIDLSVVNRVHIPATDELLAARATFDLRLEEIKQAQKACDEASNYLNFLATKALKESSLKPMEGEIIQLIECNRLFYYHNGEYQPLPCALDNMVVNNE